jgi:hypothetical protein
MTMWEHEDIFWDSQCHDFTLWESFLFLVWSFSILCLKVCELVKLVVGHLLTQSLKKIEIVPPSPKSYTFDNLTFQISNCNLQTKISLASRVLLPPLPNSMVIKYILPLLPLTNPSMFWCLHQINKG